MNADLPSRPLAQRRGTRFAISAPLLYREHGTLKWRPGATVNMSRSGVLFRVGGTPPGPARRLDFILTLPLNGPSRGANVRCTGHVVRTEPSAAAGGGHAVAVAIEGYALEGRIAD